MPSPKKGESEKDYLKRCIPEIISEGKYENKQAIAICYSKYRKDGTEKASPPPVREKTTKKKLNSTQKALLLHF